MYGRGRCEGLGRGLLTLCAQSYSWYFGLLNVAVAILSAVIYFLALRRKRSKERIQSMNVELASSVEPLRTQE